MAVKQGAVTVEGLNELRRFIRRFPDDLSKDGLKRIHDKVAEPVESEAKSRVPRRSGRLAGSIRRAKGSTKAATVRAGRASVPYAGPIHFGWPNRRVVWGKQTDGPVPIRAQPFLTDALDAKREVVFDMYEDELDKFIGVLMRQANLRP